MTPILENTNRSVKKSFFSLPIRLANFCFNIAGKRSVKIRRFKKKVFVAYRTCQLFRNPLQIFLTRSSSSFQELYLRNGLIFRVADRETTVPSIAEVWWHRVYGDLNHLQNLSAPVIIDIGAHIGSFTLLSLHTFPTAFLYSFEPDQTSYACLVENVRRNNFASRCITVHKALWSDSTPRTFYTREKNSPRNSLFQPNSTIANSQTTVACTTITNILNDYNISVCDLLKVDTQGAEFEIILSTPERYFQKIRSIVLEYHVNIPNYKPEVLFTFLQRQGYKVTLNKAARVLTAIRS